MSADDDPIVRQLIGEAADLAVAMSSFAKAHPLARSEFGSLVVPLALVHLVEMQTGIDWGTGLVATEFRKLLLAPLRRAVAKLQGPTH